MRQKIISVTQAKAKLLELTRKVKEEGLAYLLTKDGEPVSALIPLQDYESLTETLDILTHADSMANLQRALDNEKRSRLWKRDRVGRWIKSKSAKKAA